MRSDSQELDLEKILETLNENPSKFAYAHAMYDHARAFVESAVEIAKRNEEEQWKFAILHLATALELIFKARLAFEHHMHVVVGKQKPTVAQFEQGDFRSVGLEECIKRLSTVAGLTLSAKEDHALTAVRNLRNRIAHFSEPRRVSELRAVFGAGLHLFIEFNNREFSADDEPYRAKSMHELVVALHEDQAFVAARMEALRDELRAAKRPRTRHLDECGFCLQDARVIDGDNFLCLFCRHSDTIKQFAMDRSEDGETFEECPACHRPSVARHQWGDREPTFECLCCGHFRGPELNWGDWFDRSRVIPRLHADRRCD